MSEELSPRIIIDAHQDIAYNYMRHGRDYLQPALKTRQLEAQMHHKSKRPHPITGNGLPDALLGRVGIIFATIYISPGWSRFAHANLKYDSPEEAFELGMLQLDYYHRLADEDGRIKIIQTRNDLDEVLRSWEDDADLQDRKLGMVVLMEGADSIIEPKQTSDWYERGLRIIGPAWSETRYAGGTGRPGPLTDLGRELLDVMADLNMLLDLSHLTDEGVFEALDRYEGHLIASHSNPRHFIDSHRMLSDEMIIGIAERDGVVGMVTWNPFLKKGWSPSDPPDSVTIEDVVNHIDYVCQLTGSSRYVGIGSDIDGGFSADQMPHGIDTVTDFWKFNKVLANRGYSDDDIQNILNRNFLRKIRTILPT